MKYSFILYVFSTYGPCDLNGRRTEDDRVVQTNYHLAELLLHMPVVDTLSRRTYIYEKSTKENEKELMRNMKWFSQISLIPS